MISLQQQHIEAKLLLMENTIAALRAELGMTASNSAFVAVEVNSITKPKKRKGMLNADTVQFVAEYLNRPEIIQLLKNKIQC